MEIRELLSSYDFPGDDIPIIKGSALKALEDLQEGKVAKEDPNCACIFELMDAVDSYIPEPERAADKPFLMPVEDVFSITGRGTVATGRVERGTVKVQDTVEIVGLTEETRSTVVTGVEMFRKLLDQAIAGDNIGVLLRGVQRNEIERGQVLAKPGSIHPVSYTHLFELADHFLKELFDAARLSFLFCLNLLFFLFCHLYSSQRRLFGFSMQGVRCV